MKIDKMIFSCDGPYYFFWKYNSEIVKRLLGITPVLFFLTEKEETDFYEDEFGIVKKVKVDPNSPSKFQSQNYRMYGTRYFPDEVCLIGDIDMFLFNKKWLDYNVQDIDNQDLVLLNGDAYPNEKKPRYPMCYIGAKGNNFNKILNTDRSFEEYSKELFSRNQRWDTDELYFSEKLHENHHNVKFYVKKRNYSSNYFAPGRIEKYMFEKPENINIFKLSLFGSVDYAPFIDCHVWRMVDRNLLEKVTKDIINQFENNSNDWWNR
jgi:hypothetical protein